VQNLVPAGIEGSLTTWLLDAHFTVKGIIPPSGECELTKYQNCEVAK
jgi:hypothetical protein